MVGPTVRLQAVLFLPVGGAEKGKTHWWPPRERLRFQFKKRQRIISSIVNQQKVKAVKQNSIDYVVQLKKLGWANIDRFINDNKCAESNFRVKVNNSDTVGVIDMSLIIPSRNICVKSISNTKDVFGFTQKTSSLYRKLPIGEKGLIVIMAINDDRKPYSYKVRFNPQNKTREDLMCIVPDSCASVGEMMRWKKN